VVIEPDFTGTLTDLPNDDYHADQHFLSSSRLKAYLPERYKTGGSQEALDFGTLFHTVVLEPDNLGEYVALDADKIGVKADGTPAQNPTMTAAWKRAVAEVEQDGKKVIAQQDLDRAFAMRDAVAGHDTAARLLFSEDGRSELSAFAVDEDGIRHKARFDRHIPGVIVDLKSTSGKPGRESLARAVIDYGYDLSAAHYLAVAELLGIDVQAFAFVFVAKEPPYYVTVCDLDDAFLDRGRALRAKAIRRHTDPTEPAYEGATGFLTIPAPPWATREAIA
jgi:hypothetical protein